MELDDVWEAILSGDEPRIRKAWGGLTDDECQALLTHLRRMADEDGWHELQKESAATALRVIREMAE